MEPRERAETSIVATSTRRPSLEDLRAIEQGWTEPARAQLVAAANAADRWLADQPDDAARFFDDPVSVITEMADAGLLTEPVDDLLAVLRARPSAKGQEPAPREVRFGRR